MKGLETGRLAYRQRNLSETGYTRRQILHMMGLAAGTLTFGPALVGCSSEGSQAGQVTLKFWNTFSEAEIELLHALGAEYEKKNPNVKIDFFEIPFDQRETKIPTAVETDSLPDIIRADYPYQYFLAARDKLAVLDDYIRNWDRFDEIYDVAWEQVTYNGDIVGVPQDKFTSIFCFNKDKFKEEGLGSFPDTWDELIDVCQALTHDGEYGMGWHGLELFTPLLYQAGGDFFNEDLSEVTFNDDGGTAALQFMDDLVNKHKVAPPGIAGWEYANTDDALKSGTIGMAPLGSYIIANYREAKVPWTLGMGKMPEGPAGRGTPTYTAPYMVTNTSENQDAAVEFVKWLVNRENALRWAKQLDHEPIDEHTAEQDHFNSPLFTPFKESLEFASSPPPTPGFNTVAGEITQAIQSTLLRQTTPEEALSKAATNVAESLNLA